MRKFRINIILENADNKDYSKLSQALKKQSFISLKKNEYNFEGNKSIIEVNGALSSAAQAIGKRYSFTVIREKYIRA